MSKALESYGCTFAVSSGSPTAFSAVANISAIRGPGEAAGVIDVSNLDSMAVEKLMLVPDEGQVALDIYYDPSNAIHALLSAARRTRSLKKFQLTMPGTNNSIITLWGYVTAFMLNTATSQAVRAAVIIEVSEAVVDGEIYSLSGGGAAQTITNGGSGYSVGDRLTLVGGDGTAATLVVTSAPGGVIGSVQVLYAGSYTSVPASPVSLTGGSGAGATITPTWDFYIPPAGAYSVTSGFYDNGGPEDYLYGYSDDSPVIGSIDPASFSGATIKLLSTVSVSGPQVFTTSFAVYGSHPQAFFTSITVGAITVNSADAAYNDYGVLTMWEWPGVNMFTAPDGYSADIVA